MPSIDVSNLRRLAPNERLDQVRILRKLVEDGLKAAEAKVQKELELLASIERETTRELEALDRIKVPETKKVDVERLFHRPKKLEETLDEAPRQVPAENRPIGEYAQPELLRAAYRFTEGRGYERLAGIRDKLAAGDELTPGETKTLEDYSDFINSVSKVRTYIHDKDATDQITRAEKAIHQIETYKTRKLEDEPERKRDF
ncbi:hypothetical protein HY493_00590 [Candidatus Woesearchaeota archaeon]|nr:hypothetical protein [Candidatus Woesearchaeota archaeon]